MIAKFAAGRVSDQTAADILTVLSMVNFEVDVFKPGCTIGRVSQVDLFWGTLVIILIAALMFFVASLIYSCRASTPGRDEGMPHSI